MAQLLEREDERYHHSGCAFIIYTNTSTYIIMTVDEERLRIACVAAAIRGGFMLGNIKDFMEWLKCYDTIRPSDREVSFEMLAYLTEGCSAEITITASKVFKAWYLADLIETVLTEKQQDKCVRLLRRLDNAE